MFVLIADFDLDGITSFEPKSAENLLAHPREVAVNMRNGDSTIRSQDALPLILGASDVANILGISRAKAYQLFHRLDFPALKLDKRLLVRRELFFQWLDRQIQAASE